MTWLISILNRFETQIEPHDKSKIFGIAPSSFELRVGVGVSAHLQLHVATSCLQKPKSFALHVRDKILAPKLLIFWFSALF